MPLFVKKLDPKATPPTCNNPGEDLAYDLYALEDVLVYGRVHRIRTGVALKYTLHTGLSYGLLIRDRSSLAACGLFVTGGVIDEGYTGEILVLMTTTYGTTYKIEAGNKIAQVIPIPVRTDEKIVVLEADQELIGTRGDKGFGSSGR